MAEICERLHEVVNLRIRTMALRLIVWKGAKRLVAAMGTSCSRPRPRPASDDGGASNGSSYSSSSSDDGSLAGCCGAKGTRGVMCYQKRNSGTKPLFFLPDEERHARARLIYRQKHGDQSLLRADATADGSNVSSLILTCVDALCGSSDSVLEALVADIPLDLIQVIFDRLIQRGGLTAELVSLFEPAHLCNIQLPSYPGVTDAWLLILAGESVCVLDLSDCEHVHDAGLAALRSASSLRRLLLANCINVTDLGLSHIAGSHRLKELDLKGCDGIKGSGLCNLAGLTSLTTLNLEMCRKLETGLEHLQGMRCLRQLSVGWSFRLPAEEICHLGSLDTLKELNLARTQATDDALDSLLELTALENLCLAGCPVTSAGVASAAESFGSLTSLSLERCYGINDVCFEAIGAMLPKLQSLNAAHTGITGDALRAISNLKLLEDLNLDSCDLIVDQSFTHLRLLTALKSLDLSDTVISNMGAEALTSLTGLNRLDLSCSNLNDAGAAHLRLLPDLLDLRLESRHITDAALGHIQGMTRLESLEMYGARITDKGMGQIAKLKTLRHLEVCSGHITNAGVERLLGIPALRSLNLAQNPGISDSALSSLKSMTGLEVLNLSQSHVTGGGLMRLSGLPKLTTLALYGAPRIRHSAVAKLQDKAPHITVLGVP